MTNEQLTELARQYAQDRYCYGTNETPKYKIAQIHAGRDGFIKGAKYMRNSPWHDVKETPSSKYILVERGRYFDVVIIEKEIWQKYVENYGVKRYAYIEDLIPMED